MSIRVVDGSETFQFTPLREGRLSMIGGLSGGMKFQFTPLREGRRDFVLREKIIAFLFQFTPLREGRQQQTSPQSPQHQVSIHAPA